MLPAVRGDSLVTSVALMGEFKLLMSFQYPINIKIEQLRERFSDISSHADGYVHTIKIIIIVIIMEP
jgi:hypothetical protein